MEKRSVRTFDQYILNVVCGSFLMHGLLGSMKCNDWILTPVGLARWLTETPYD